MLNRDKNVYACSYTLPFRGNSALLHAMHKAKSLYNATLWYYRQALDEHHLAKKENRDPLVEYPDYYKMERKFRDEHQYNYFDLPQKVSQQVLRDVQSDWSSYVAHVVRNKAYPEGSPERIDKINPPRYKKKEGYAHTQCSDVFIGLTPTHYGSETNYNKIEHSWFLPDAKEHPELKLDADHHILYCHAICGFFSTGSLYSPIDLKEMDAK